MAFGIVQARRALTLKTALESNPSEFVAVYGLGRVVKTCLVRETAHYHFPQLSRHPLNQSCSESTDCTFPGQNHEKT